MSKDLVVKEEAGLPTVIDFSTDCGAGFEEADSSSYAIPFLRVLQSLSPQTKKRDPEYVEGAEEGDLFNTVSGKIYKGDEGITVLPCHYIHKYTLWAPNRGGYRGSVDVATYATMKKYKGKDSNGNDVDTDDQGNVITDTREHYLLVINPDGTLDPALLSVSSSQIKKSKKWMTQMQGIRVGGSVAPMYSQLYKLSTVNESNDKGSWAGLKIEHIAQVNNVDQYQTAKSFRDMVRSGEMKAQEPSDEIPF